MSDWSEADCMSVRDAGVLADDDFAERGMTAEEIKRVDEEDYFRMMGWGEYRYD